MFSLARRLTILASLAHCRCAEVPYMRTQGTYRLVWQRAAAAAIDWLWLIFLHTRTKLTRVLPCVLCAYWTRSSRLITGVFFPSLPSQGSYHQLLASHLAA